MTKYEEAAVQAIKIIQNSETMSPIEAWEKATKIIFGNNPSAQKKSCPRDAFLGLCDAGLIKGVTKGSYTKSVKNKQYAIEAVDILKKNPYLDISPNALWQIVQAGVKKAHNSQMDVVLGLWNQNLIE